jgi:hypothetical protein
MMVHIYRGGLQLQALTKLWHRRFAGIPEARFMNVQLGARRKETTDGDRRA